MNTHNVQPTSGSSGKRLMAVGLLLSALSASAPACWAQIMGGGGGGHRGQRSQQQQTTPQPPPLPNLPQVWPRLDPGSVLCETRDDLTGYQARLAAGSNDTEGVPPRCRMIQEPVGITILERDGLSQTKVMLSGAAKEIGWTNVYLPTTAPAPPMTSAQSESP